MRLLLAIALLFCGIQLRAESTEIQVPGSISAKADRELVLIPMSDDPPGESDVIRVTVRQAKSHREIGFDKVLAFGKVPALEPYMQAAWSPTGEYIAFNLRYTFKSTDTFVYRVTNSGITRIEFPYYWGKAQKALRTDSEFFKGVETPLRWRDNHTLILRLQGIARDETEFDVLMAAAFTNSKCSIRSVTRNE